MLDDPESPVLPLDESPFTPPVTIPDYNRASKTWQDGSPIISTVYGIKIDGLFRFAPQLVLAYVKISEDSFYGQSLGGS